MLLPYPSLHPYILALLRRSAKPTSAPTLSHTPSCMAKQARKKIRLDDLRFPDSSLGAPEASSSDILFWLKVKTLEPPRFVRVRSCQANSLIAPFSLSRSITIVFFIIVIISVFKFIPIIKLELYLSPWVLNDMKFCFRGFEKATYWNLSRFNSSFVPNMF